MKYVQANNEFLYYIGVYLSLNDDIIPNHGYVAISDIGFTNDTALICHTDHPATFDRGRHSGGNWFAPNETRVNYLDIPGVRRNRGPMVVRLRRYSDSGAPPEGIYYCEVEDERFVNQRVYIGVHGSEKGRQI